MIKRLFSPPVFENMKDNFRAKFLNGFAWIVCILLLVALISNLGPGADENSATTIIFSTGLIFVMLLTLYLLRRGNLNASGLFIVTLGWLGLGLQAYTADGVRDIIIVGYIAISLLASIIIDWRAGSIVMILSIGAIWTLAILEVNGLLRPGYQETIAFSRDLSLVFIAIAVLIYFSTTSLIDAITRATNSEQSQIASNKNLQELNQTLEERVNKRTSELDLANQRNEIRARQFEAISQVSRAISQTQNLQDLLPQITEVISQQFGFYHVGIFLIDLNREYAVLGASNSEGGKRMLARSHKLRIGQTGIVGNVAKTGKVRVALDAGADAIYFNNPDLPETRSEMALPLFQASGQIIGILDIQSTIPDAFHQADVEVLTTLADQVSVAITNARLYEDTQRTLLEAEMVYRQNLKSGWGKYTRSQNLAGIRRRGMKSSFLIEALEIPGSNQVVQFGSIYHKRADAKSSSTQLTMPMKLRGEVVGMLNLKTDHDREWTSDEMDIITAIIERAALSIENARLLEESRKIAEKERIIGEISTRIGEGTEIETILKTAVRELGSQISGAQITVEIGGGDG